MSSTWSDWSIGFTFSGTGLVLIAYFFDVPRALWSNGYRTIDDQRNRTCNLSCDKLATYLFQWALWLVGWILLDIALGKNIQSSTTSDYQSMNSATRIALVVLAAVCNIIIYTVAGAFWYNRKVYAGALVGLVVLLIFYYMSWGLIIAMVNLGTNGIWNGLSYAIVAIPLFEPVAFALGGQDRCSPSMVASMIVRIPALAGYFFLAGSICAIVQ